MFQYFSEADGLKRIRFTGVFAAVLLFCFASCLFADGLYGDFTDDNTVNINDLAYFFDYWLEDDCNLPAEIDLNHDCTVNFYEFSKFANNWQLSAPQNLMVPPEAFDDSNITLIWSKPPVYSNVASYNVYRNGVLLGNTTKLFYNVTGLTAATPYSFIVKSANSSGTELADSNTIAQSTSPAMQVFNITSYGAVGDGTTLNTTAIQNAINACTAGGKVHLRAVKHF
jgi:hypothetical protein